VIAEVSHGLEAKDGINIPDLQASSATPTAAATPSKPARS